MSNITASHRSIWQALLIALVSAPSFLNAAPPVALLQTAEGDLSVEWSSQPAQRYHLEWSPDLTVWHQVNAFPLRAAGHVSSLNLNSLGLWPVEAEAPEARFFRILHAPFAQSPLADWPGLSIEEEVMDWAGATLSATNAAGDRVTLRLPPNALPFSTTIRLRLFEQAPEASPFSQPVFPGVWIEPHGLVLNHPATLTVELAGVSGEEGKNVLFYLGATGSPHPLTGLRGTRTMTAQLDHFSGYVGATTSVIEAQSIAELDTGPSADPCNQTYDRTKRLVDWAVFFEFHGAYELAQQYMDAAIEIVQADLANVLSQPIPDPMGLFCKSNPTTDYMKCLNRLSVYASLLYAEDNTAEMEKLAQAADLWTTQFAFSNPPLDADEYCRVYAPCVHRAMVERYIFEVPPSHVDEILESLIEFDDTFNDVAGCGPCSVRWTVFAEARASFLTSCGTATGNRRASIGAAAQFPVFNFVIDRESFETDCLRLDESGGFIDPYGPYPTLPDDFEPLLEAQDTWLLDTDHCWATEAGGARLEIAGSPDTNDLYLYFSILIEPDPTQLSLHQPLNDFIGHIRKRRPFLISGEWEADDGSGYRERITLRFLPHHR